MSKSGEFIGALAANFIVAGVVAKLQSGSAAAISFTVGLALLAVYFFYFRKKNETVSPPQPIHIENKPDISPTISPNISPTFSQTFNPTIHIGTHDSDSRAAEQEHAKQEAFVLEHLKQKHPATGYEIDELAADLNLSRSDVRDIMERLKTKQAVWSVNLMEAVGGVAYFLDELHHPNPRPPEAKS